MHVEKTITLRPSKVIFKTYPNTWTILANPADWKFGKSNLYEPFWNAYPEKLPLKIPLSENLCHIGILLISRSLSETHVLNFSFPALVFFGVPIIMPLYSPPPKKKRKKKRLSRPVPLSSASSSMASNSDRVRKMYTSWSCCSCNVWVDQLMGSFSFYGSTYIITKKCLPVLNFSKHPVSFLWCQRCQVFLFRFLDQLTQRRDPKIHKPLLSSPSKVLRLPWAPKPSFLEVVIVNNLVFRCQYL